MTRFSEAWAQVATQNHVLKLITLSLGVTSVMLGLALTKSALKPPLIIERGCYSKVVSRAVEAVTADEMEGFIKEALSARFDSISTAQPDYLSIDELKARASEQTELAKRGMKQRVLINGLKRTGDTVEVDSDRLISVGSIRSALPFPLTVEIEATARTEGDPYGMVLIKTRPVKAADSPELRGGAGSATPANGVSGVRSGS